MHHRGNGNNFFSVALTAASQSGYCHYFRCRGLDGVPELAAGRGGRVPPRRRCAGSGATSSASPPIARAQLAAAHAAYFSALPRVADALARFASHHHAATPPGSPVLTLPPSDPDEPKKPNVSSSTTPHTGSGHSHIHFHDDVSEDGTDGPDSSSSDACTGPGGCGGGAHAAEIPQPAPAVLHSGVPPPDHGHGQPQQRQARQPVPGMPSWDGQHQQPQLHQPLHHQPVPAMPGMPSWDAPPQERQLHHQPPPYQYQQPAEMPPPWGEYAAASYNPYPSFPNPTFQDDATFQDRPPTFQEDRPTFPRYYYMQASATPASTVYQDPYGYGNFDTNMSYMGYYNNPMYGVPMPPPEGDNSRPPPPAAEDRRAREPAPPLPMPVPETSPWDFFNPFDAYEQEELPPQYGSSGRGGGGYGGGGGGSATSSPNSSEGDDGQGNVDKVSSAEQRSSVVVGEDVRLPENVVGTRDVAEVVEEIKEQFNSVASCGEDVARILEVGRMRYRSRKKILRCK
ncbi:hypothetical protein PR202_ga04723 [Eleusine coracana subsp. coracana]|uniref:Uncharacterized protein n=1 Tax=Eleusine coracana subsp. coracana TaxID=191504 RepID=A0AAV5BSS6_ELECO|nr:hypothetical protein PR202_ga04723 [Eleusine coracana subsp. coracana]